MDFQTPKIVADYMASMIPDNAGTILEPTPGLGNLIQAVSGKGNVTAPIDFWQLSGRFDYAIMNPPFSPVIEGWRYLKAVMGMTDNIVALIPWLILINSERRIVAIKEFGLKSVTHLPRKTFPGTRIQCCVVELKKGYQGESKFKTIHF